MLYILIRHDKFIMSNCGCCDPGRADHKKLNLLVTQADKRYGCHVGLQSTLCGTLQSIPDCKCLQCFLGAKYKYNCRTLTSADKRKTAQYCADNDKTFYVHCPYVANLSSDNPEYRDKSFDVVSKSLDQLKDLPGACVLHIGAKGTIENVGEYVNQLSNLGYLERKQHDRMPYPLLLEVAAGQGTSLGKTWEEMRHLYESIDKTNVGLCIDTQHVFASGMCDFEDHESVVKMFDHSDWISRKGVSMFHINDSDRPFASRVDRHAPLKQGHIWSVNDESLRSLVDICTDMNIDMIAETKDHENDFAVLAQI